MGIEDIMREQRAAGEPAPRTPGERDRQQQQQRRPRVDRSNGTIDLSIPDPMSGDPMAALMWLNLVQTALIIWLIWTR